jgi:hypothetical protein
MRDGRTLELSREEVASVLQVLADEPVEPMRAGALSLRAHLDDTDARHRPGPLDLTHREEAALMWALGVAGNAD